MPAAQAIRAVQHCIGMDARLLGVLFWAYLLIVSRERFSPQFQPLTHYLVGLRSRRCPPRVLTAAFGGLEAIGAT